jgi:eukaryotic-like serine/threonine-protein kinase
MVSESNNPQLQESADVDSAADPVLPEQYQVLFKVSEGGMGAIYKAQNRYTGATFAIKVLRTEFALDEEYRQRFILEAKAAGSLKHANICPVHDFGLTQAQTLYLVMDWIQGISLSKKVLRDGPLSVSAALPVFEQVATALECAHQHGVIHRDLKPDNIILSREPETGITHTYLVDFGVAKVLTGVREEARDRGLTPCGTVVGTPMYMSPEQARELEVDGRADIYSLGCVMYFVLTGKPPFVAETALDTMFKHVNETPAEIDPALKVPGDMRKTILKCLEKNPVDRYQNAGQLLSDISKMTRGLRLGNVVLASEKQKQRQRLGTVALFVIGFVLMYVISTGAQMFLDKLNPDNDKKSSPEHSAPTRQK